VRGVSWGLSRGRRARPRRESAGSRRQPRALHTSLAVGYAFHLPFNREGREEREGRKDGCLLGQHDALEPVFQKTHPKVHEQAAFQAGRSKIGDHLRAMDFIEANH